MIDNKFKVDFIGVGLEKSGSSWVAAALAEHPEICFSNQKEVHFFNKNYEKGLDFYASYFKDCETKKIKGEFTPRYFYIPEVPGRIKKEFAQAKLIFCFRNPIDRIYSHFYHNIAHARISNKTPFEQAIRQDPRFIDYGRLSDNLKRFLKYFKQEQMLFIFYDDIVTKPQEVARKVYQFVGVDLDYKPKVIHQKVNVGAAKRYKYPVFKIFLRKLMHFSMWLKKYNFGRKILNWLASLGLKKLFQKLFRLNILKNPPALKKQPMKAETRKELIKLYKEDVKEFEKLVRKDLSQWYE